MSGGIDLAVLRVRAGAGEPLQWNAGVVLALVEAVEAARNLAPLLRTGTASSAVFLAALRLEEALAVFDTGPHT